MQKIFGNKLIFLLILFFSVSNLEAKKYEKVNPDKKAVTYSLVGRLGNHLVSYLHAKWFSYHYKVPFLYVPFPYSNQFKFHEIEKNTLLGWKVFFKNKVVLEKDFDLADFKNSTVIEIPFFRDEGKFENDNAPFKTNWKNPKFKALVRSLIKPRFPLKTIVPPKKKGVLNVLLHIRTGGGRDSDRSKLRFPRKFPPLEFYISAIKLLSEKVNHSPLFLFLMTDDANPKALVSKIKKALPENKNLKFGYRKGKNGHAINVLEDFFSIPNFKALIRADSTFSIVASLLADLEYEIYPKNCHVENDKILLDSITVLKRGVEQ